MRRTAFLSPADRSDLLLRDALAETRDLVHRQPARGFDRHGCRGAGADLDGRDLEDAIGVHREADLDLGAPARRGFKIAEHEATDAAILRRDLVFALMDLD